MVLLPVTFAFIDKGRSGFPLYIKTAMVDPRMVWEYFQNDNLQMINAMKQFLGIRQDTPTYSGVWVDYLIHPVTGEILHSDDGESLEEFLNSVRRRQRGLLSEDYTTFILPKLP